jgi:hypothetical protein
MPTTSGHDVFGWWLAGADAYTLNDDHEDASIIVPLLLIVDSSR